MTSDARNLSGTLLARLNRGDIAAAEELYLKYAPYLRIIARRHISGRLRAKFDSTDVVQSVWADLLIGFRETRWHFSDEQHLRAFLVKSIRHRFFDRLRQQRAALQNERSLTHSDDDRLEVHQSSCPGQRMCLSELWQQMVKLCPPRHRLLLEMKRNGSSLTEIAEKTGYHSSSIRRILYGLASKFVLQQRRTQVETTANKLRSPFSSPEQV